MSKYLKVSEEWYDWFVENSMEVVTTIDNREFFKYVIEGEFQNYQITYNLIFEILKIFKQSFTFLEIEKIRLQYSEGINLNNLQFYSIESLYDKWEESILTTFNEVIKYDDFYEDSTNIFFNYLINVEGVEKKLYYLSQNDSADLYLFYDENKNVINYKINITLRKILFKYDNDLQVNMLNNVLDYNSYLLDSATSKLKKELQTI